ncbi:MAG: hypothetical protein AAF138_10360 [Planctomycetota bacterium]
MATQQDHRRDPDALLCESCGYVLSGLDVAGACPECGRSIESSLPDRRPGPRVLDEPSFRNWLGYARGAIFGGAADRTSIRIDESSARRLLTLNVRLAAAAPALGLVGWLVAQLMVHPAGELARDRVFQLGVIVGLPVCVLALAPMLRLLTWIERRGIMLFGRRHGWRVTREVALSVCAHASIGWVVATSLATLGVFVGMALAGARTPISWRSYIDWAPMALPVLAFGVGMICFELMVFLGVRACRYANRPGAC